MNCQPVNWLWAVNLCNNLDQEAGTAGRGGEGQTQRRHHTGLQIHYKCLIICYVYLLLSILTLSCEFWQPQKGPHPCLAQNIILPSIQFIKTQKLTSLLMTTLSASYFHAPFWFPLFFVITAGGGSLILSTFSRWRPRYPRLRPCAGRGCWTPGPGPGTSGWAWSWSSSPPCSTPRRGSSSIQFKCQPV